MLTLNGLRIGFIHNREENSTTCFMDGEQGLSIAARAKCSDSDKFSREIGRELSSPERLQLLRKSMGEQLYEMELNSQMPFDGGFSFYYNEYKIPTHSRQPYLLPKLIISNKKFFNCNDINIMINHLDISDFQLENYQAHSAIMAPLSN